MMNMRKIKVWLVLAWLATTSSAPAQPIPFHLDIIDMAAISRMTPQQLELLAEGLAAEEILRTKRSSAQAISSVVSKASSGLQSKVSLLGQASAGASSFISAASSKSGNEHEGYHYEPEHTKVDFWGLKKSILYTLFQAVKAITGGVTILKGQLIKGGGALAASLGKVISKKGDTVSHFGQKIVSSAALSEKKPSHPVYGPPAEYGPPPPSYTAPSAPAHYSVPSAPAAFTPHKYNAHLDDNEVYQTVPLYFKRIGRGNKLNGVHAGVVILTPLTDAHGVPEEHLQTAHSGSSPLDPPHSIIHSVYSAVKNVFSPDQTSHNSIYPPTSYAEEPILTHQPPPSIQPYPAFKPMTWGAVNSYGEPAAVDAYPHYNPHNPIPTFDYAAPKLSRAPPTSYYKHNRGLTPDKIQKITNNLKKVHAYMNGNQRSSEELPQFNPQVGEMLKKGLVPILPTPVVSDNEIGVLPGDFLTPSPTTSTTDPPTTPPPIKSTTSAPTADPTTVEPKTEGTQRRKKDLKYFLRGNKIVQV